MHDERARLILLALIMAASVAAVIVARLAQQGGW